MTARSFLTTSPEGDGLARALAEARHAVNAPAAGLVFVSGTLGQEVKAAAEVVRQAWRGVPALVVPSAGVLHERGEAEGTRAASGILWSGGRAVPFAVPDQPADICDALGEALASLPVAGAAGAGAKVPPTIVLFTRADAVHPQSFERFASYAPETCLFGGGAVGTGPAAITASGEIIRGRAVGLALFGLARPIVEASPAARLISDFAPIEEASGGMVLRIAGRPALDHLSSLSGEARSEGQNAPVVFAAVADESPGDDGHERFVLRAVRGIDPGRRGVLIGPEAKPGVRCAFAVRDGAAARADLERAARSAQRQALGSAPRFAIHVTCAGRGQGLYGAPDVESRILRARFGDLPIAGMHSSFELSSSGPGRVKMQLFTGVLALFRSPS